MTALNLNAATAFTPSTSGSYGFSVSRDQVIRQAMLDIGALDPYEYPTASEIADCAFKLNMMVKSWMGNTDFAPGLKVWTRKRGELFLGQSKYLYNLGQTGDNWAHSTTGLTYPQIYGQTTLAANTALGGTVLSVATVSQLNINDYIGVLLSGDIFWSRIAAINPVPNPPTVTIATPLPAQALSTAYVWNYTTKALRPLSIVSVLLRDIYANDTPIDLLTVERYESLATKTSPQNIADPTAVLYESQWSSSQPNGQLYLDVAGAQDVTKHLHIVYLRPVQDLINPGDALDYPQQWYRPLVLGHGKDICDMFSCVWTPSLESNYQDSLAIARQADPANTDVFFEVNGGSSAYGL